MYLSYKGAQMSTGVYTYYIDTGSQFVLLETNC